MRCPEDWPIFGTIGGLVPILFLHMCRTLQLKGGLDVQLRSLRMRLSGGGGTDDHHERRCSLPGWLNLHSHDSLYFKLYIIRSRVCISHFEGSVPLYQ
jgi:hypothetical protein